MGWSSWRAIPKYEILVYLNREARSPVTSTSLVSFTSTDNTASSIDHTSTLLLVQHARLK